MDARAEHLLRFEEITQQFSIYNTCFDKRLPSSVAEARYNLNILSCRGSYNLNMLITTTSIKAKRDKRIMKREKETAKITAQLAWKVTGLYVSPVDLE